MNNCCPAPIARVPFCPFDPLADRVPSHQVLCLWEGGYCKRIQVGLSGWDFLLSGSRESAAWVMGTFLVLKRIPPFYGYPFQGNQSTKLDAHSTHSSVELRSIRIAPARTGAAKALPAEAEATSHAPPHGLSGGVSRGRNG